MTLYPAFLLNAPIKEITAIKPIADTKIPAGIILGNGFHTALGTNEELSFEGMTISETQINDTHISIYTDIEIDIEKYIEYLNKIKADANTSTAITTIANRIIAALNDNITIGGITYNPDNMQIHGQNGASIKIIKTWR